jgi:hypothetical protein
MPNPGSMKIVKVIYRLGGTNNGITGITKGTEQVKGCFPAKVSFITRALAYSGSETTLGPDAPLPLPVARFIFFMDKLFDYRYAEFHYKGRVYIPRDPGFEVAGGIAYNCVLQQPDGTAEYV